MELLLVIKLCIYIITNPEKLKTPTLDHNVVYLLIVNVKKSFSESERHNNIVDILSSRDRESMKKRKRMSI